MQRNENSRRPRRRRSTFTNLVRRLPAVLVLGAVVAGDARAQHSHGPGSGHAHGPNLHVSSRWKECSFQLDAALTQRAWRQFTGEAGVVAYFRPLIDAAPMGKGRWEVSALQWKTGIDDADAAWNDTFVHPDSAHWLFEGSGLQFPGLTARVGVSDRTDVGVYFTKSPRANYGFYGVQVQQNMLGHAGGAWAASARASVVSLFGPEDVDFQVFGADLVASRRIGLVSNRVALSPYASVSASLSRSHEKSSVVDLEDERVFGAQASVGAVMQVAGIRLAVETTAARVPNVSLKVGFGRGL